MTIRVAALVSSRFVYCIRIMLPSCSLC